MKTLSIIIPVINEAESIPELWSRLKKVLDKINYQTEIIFIDDGSTDNTLNVIKNIGDKRVKAISFVRNYTKSPALSAGFENASGDVIITMDGDLQHEPEEIPKFLEKIESGYDMAIMWRHQRKDNLITRRIPSKIANLLISKLSGINIHDFGGTFHAYKKQTLEGLELYSELHRFIPALVSWSGGYKIAEVPVTNPPRKYGKSNYGLGRIVKVFFDLITVKYFGSFVHQSLQFFGLIGLTFITLGGLGGTLYNIQENISRCGNFYSTWSLVYCFHLCFVNWPSIYNVWHFK